MEKYFLSVAKRIYRRILGVCRRVCLVIFYSFGFFKNFYWSRWLNPVPYIPFRTGQDETRRGITGCMKIIEKGPQSAFLKKTINILKSPMQNTTICPCQDLHFDALIVTRCRRTATTVHSLYGRRLQPAFRLLACKMFDVAMTLQLWG